MIALAHQLVHARSEDVLRDTRTLAEIVERSHTNLRRMTEAIARLPGVGLSQTGLDDHARLLRERDGFDVIATRVDGTPWFSSLTTTDQIKAWSERLAGAGPRTMTRLVSHPDRRGLRVGISTPIRVGAESAGTLHVLLPTERLAPISAQVSLPEGARWAIVDGTGTIVARSENPEQFVGQKVPRSLIDAQTAPFGIHWATGIDNDKIVRTWAYFGEDRWYVSIGMAQTIITRPLWVAIGTGVAVLGIALLLNALLTATLTRAIVTPVKVLVSQALAPSPSGTDTPIDVREFETIGRTLITQARLQHSMQRELEHRTRNHLAVIQSIASSTVRAPRGTDEARELLLGRLTALARANSLQLKARMSGADLATLIDETMQSFSGRYSATGPEVRVGPRAAQGMALILHELATNAVKYGALLAPEGSVVVVWRRASAGLAFTWEERGGPSVVSPTHTGFGISLIRNILGPGVDVDLVFHPGGLVATITIPDAVISDGLTPMGD